MAHQMAGKRVAFIGRLQKYKKKDVIARLELAGGKACSNISSLTDFVVVADLNIPNITQLHIDAVELNKQGVLEMVDETKFVAMLDSSDE